MQCLLTIAYALVTPFGGFALLTGCGCAWQCTGDRIAIPDRIFLLITISFIHTNRVKSRFTEHFTRRVDKPAVFAYYNRNKGVVCPFGKKANSLDEESTPRLRLTESPKDGTGQVSTGWKMASELWE